MSKKDLEGGPSPSSEPENVKPGLYFLGLHDQAKVKRYPAWRYHDVLAPKIVRDTDEDCQASGDGWKEVEFSRTVNPRLLNWHWDLEDFSAEQMVLFAKAEFNIELPVEAGKEKIFKTIWELTKSAPNNRDRIILMAQTVDMEYEETLEEIKRTIKTGDAETTTEEFYA